MLARAQVIIQAKLFSTIDTENALECTLKDQNTGYCTSQATKSRILFPGEPCKKDAECPFGGRKCKYESAFDEKRCTGLEPTEKCHSSSDCMIGYSCVQAKDAIPSCLKIRFEPGQSCADDESCGGAALCHFDKISETKGRCIEFLSLNNGEYIGTEIPDLEGTFMSMLFST